MPSEYIIYCDESETKGRRFSNFYGGALVDSDNLEAVKATIAAKKNSLNLFGEIKWNKVTANYYRKYIDLIECFFDLVEAGQVKIRIMFTQNQRIRGSKLTREHRDNEYAILYYYFIRHAFGLTFSPPQNHDVIVRVYPDQLPLTKEQARIFKDFVVRLGNRSEFKARRLIFKPENVVEVVSHDHDILQCLDVVLGAMNFRLTEKHLEKPPGKKRRSPKTLGREKVYKAINKRIQKIYPNFNIGITTGHGGDLSNRWRHRYRHWNFKTSKRWE